MSWPDVEGAVVAHLKGVTAVSALVGQRVFFGVPKKATESSYPLVVVSRVGGGPEQGTDAPVDVALLQLDVWAGIDASGNGKKAEAWGVVNAVVDALEDIRRRTVVGSTVALFGAHVESVLWLPDPDNDRPRYVVTAEVTAMSA
jgi:hypothetical protein